jgi:hypothetical protein
MAVIASMACLGFQVATQAQQRPAIPTSAAEEFLKKFLQDYARQNQADDDKTTRYVHTFFDLNSDGKDEAIVYLVGREWCGSGGCSTLVLASEASSYKVVTELTVTQLPIRILPGTSNGWCNLGVWVQGGGIQPGYEAELRFDGKSYPENPTVPPARRLERKVTGKIVISASQDETHLYP